MSRLFLTISAVALIAAGCDDDNNSTAYRQSPSQNKLAVSVVPVIDSTKTDYEWSLSDEFSSALYDRLSQQNHIQLTDSSKVREKTRRLAEKNNPFSADISWVKNAFQGDEFVVFLELVEHDEVFDKNPRKQIDPKDCNAELNMTMRVRVFDLRDQEPKVILQELVQDNHFIPRQFTSENFYQVAWGDESYSISPVGLAHAKFSKEIAVRIENYILMSAK